MEDEEGLCLPYELIIQILLRLPVKSLLCFKCVCKSWFSLISDPHFANSHVDVSVARILLISRTPPPVGISSTDFETSINHDHNSASLNHNFLRSRRYYFCDIKGSCRGFIFLHCSTNFYVWNPSTRFYKQIPLSPFDSKLHDYHLNHLYGFGYDRPRDDYLVVLLSYDSTFVKTSSHLEFFSLRDNTWNEIESPHFTYLNSPTYLKVGLFSNEAIHWLASRHHDSSEEVIVAFDLIERKLLEIPLPDDFDHGPVYYGLWVFGEFLSLWNMNFHNHTLEIWAMKEYKLHFSWTKTPVISIDDDILCFSPIYSTKSGDIIGTDGDRGLVKYNDKGLPLEYLEMNLNASEVAMYKESMHLVEVAIVLQLQLQWLTRDLNNLYFVTGAKEACKHVILDSISNSCI